ncbi:hypothetical protein Droror1_Dr00008760 [Drosera rotundifolia]
MLGFECAENVVDGLGVELAIGLTMTWSRAGTVTEIVDWGLGTYRLSWSFRGRLKCTSRKNARQEKHKRKVLRTVIEKLRSRKSKICGLLVRNDGCSASVWVCRGFGFTAGWVNSMEEFGVLVFKIVEQVAHVGLFVGMAEWEHGSLSNDETGWFLPLLRILSVLIR